MIEVVAIDTPSLGDRTYLATDGVSALVVDAQRVTVVDVRHWTERAVGHIDGSLHIPLHQLLRRLPELPRGPVWVHCQAGYRASIAASLLRAAGLTVTAVDDDFSRAADAGLTLAGPSGRMSAAG